MLLVGTASVCLAQDGPRTYGSGASAAGGEYGQHRPVGSLEDARKVLKEFFGKRGEGVGTVTEKELFFEADVLDAKGVQVDRIILDKRTGRIRSIY